MAPASRRGAGPHLSIRCYWNGQMASNRNRRKLPASMRRRSCLSHVEFAVAAGQLVQQRFPVGWHFPCGAGNGLASWMRVRRKQLRALDFSPRLVVVEPVLTGLEAGNDRMPRLCRMPGCVLARRAVAATDVSTLRTTAEVKPPTIRGRQTFHAPIATWFRSGVDPAEICLHCDLPSEVACPAKSTGIDGYLDEENRDWLRWVRFIAP